MFGELTQIDCCDVRVNRDAIISVKCPIENVRVVTHFGEMAK